MAKTADQMALEILMDGGPHMQQRLVGLAAAVRRQMYGGECPSCGDPGPHDDNGERGDDLMFCCRSCGEHFDAVR